MEARYVAVKDTSEQLRSCALEDSEGLVMADRIKEQVLKWLDKVNGARSAIER